MTRRADGEASLPAVEHDLRELLRYFVLAVVDGRAHDLAVELANMKHGAVPDMATQIDRALWLLDIPYDWLSLAQLQWEQGQHAASLQTRFPAFDQVAARLRERIRPAQLAP